MVNSTTGPFYVTCYPKNPKRQEVLHVNGLKRGKVLDKFILCCRSSKISAEHVIGKHYVEIVASQCAIFQEGSLVTGLE